MKRAALKSSANAVQRRRNQWTTNWKRLPMCIHTRSSAFQSVLVIGATFLADASTGWTAPPPSAPSKDEKVNPFCIPTEEDLLRMSRESKNRKLVGDVSGMLLADAVKDFNKRAKDDSIGK